MVTTREKTGISVRWMTLTAVGLAAIGGALLFFLSLANPAKKTSCPDVKPIVGLSSQTSATPVPQVVLQDLEAKITSRGNAYGKRKTKATQNELIGLLTERKRLLVDLLAQDPESAAPFLQFVSSHPNVASIGTNCLEQAVTIAGRMSSGYLDYLGPAIRMDSLTTADGHRYALRSLHGEIPTTADTVEIRGIEINSNQIVFDATASQPSSALGSIRVTASTPTPPAAVAAVQSIPTLVILANFSDRPTPTLTSQSVIQTLNATNNFYAQASYGHVQFHGVLHPDQPADVVGWVTMSIGYTCSFTDTFLPALAAVDAQVDFRNYSRVIVVAPFRCGWAGFANLKPEHWQTQDGFVPLIPVWLPDYVPVPNGEYIVSHELGHTVGLEHASFLDCGSDSYPADRHACLYRDDLRDSDAGVGDRIGEYDDIYDVMGGMYPSATNFNAVHMSYAGWFAPTNIQTITTSGTYQLEPIETASAGLKALRIPGTNGDNLFVEYRQPLGRDVALSTASYFQEPTDVFSGALVHSTALYIRGGAGTQSFLLDPTPPGDYRTSALPVGGTFTDPTTGTTIQILSKTPSLLTVRVTVGASNVPPTVTLTSPATISGSQTIQATATDSDDTIQRVEFYASGGPPGPLAVDTSAPYSVNVDSRLISNGARSLWAIAYDSRGMKGTSTLVSVTVSNIDTTPPTVSVVLPTGDVIGEGLGMRATASDNVGIRKILLFYDSWLWGVNYGNTVSGHTFATAGPHQVYAVAYDFAGNTTTSATKTFNVSLDTGGGGCTSPTECPGEIIPKKK